MIAPELDATHLRGTPRSTSLSHSSLVLEWMADKNATRQDETVQPIDQRRAR